MPVATRLISALADHAAAEFGFKAMNVLVAFRRQETPELALDWLSFHQKTQGAEGAVIVCCDQDAGFSDGLSRVDVPILILRADVPLKDGIYEHLRKTVLKDAAAVAFLDISDLAMPDPSRTIFDHIRDARGGVTQFHGTPCYPWRLRQGRPAPFGDHIAVDLGADLVRSWGAVPTDRVWSASGPADAERNKVPTLPFFRAMGVANPSVPVGQLVRKSDLSEVPDLLAMMKTHFAAKPIRLPKAAPIPPRPASQKLTVISVMKNEGPFVLDWIAHNRALGIDQHLIYTNDCADGTDHMLDLLTDAGVTRRDNPYRLDQVPQHGAFKAAETEPVVRHADWLLTLDVDEYINIHAGDGHLSDVLTAVPDAHLLSMRWRLFGNADVHEFEDRPVTKTFTQAAPDIAPQPLQAWAFKTLYRNAGLFRRIGVHRPKGLTASLRDVRWVNGAGRDIPSKTWATCWRDTTEDRGYELVTVNHYAVRTAESFLVKRERGRANHVENDLGTTYWFRMNHNAVRDTSIQRRAPATAMEKARLLALPGVADAHARSVDWHKARIKALKATPDYAQLYAQITASKMEKLSRLATKFGPNVHYFGPDIVPDDIANTDPNTEFYFNGTPDIQRTIKELRDARPDPDLFRAR